MKSRNCWLRTHVKTSHLHIPAQSPVPTSLQFCSRSAAQRHLNLKAKSFHQHREDQQFLWYTFTLFKPVRHSFSFSQDKAENEKLELQTLCDKKTAWKIFLLLHAAKTQVLTLKPVPQHRYVKIYSTVSATQKLCLESMTAGTPCHISLLHYTTHASSIQAVPIISLCSYTSSW